MAVVFVPAQGTVVDFYEVYSVHQHGMAPAILHHAIRHGVAGAREALVKGFVGFSATTNWAARCYGLNCTSSTGRKSAPASAAAGPRGSRALANAALNRCDKVGTA